MTLPAELIPTNQSDSEFSVTCPYLGTMPDPHTSVAYPSGANYCHRADNPQLVSLTHQSQHCLMEAYDNCPTFREDHIPVASIDVAGPVKKRVNWKRPLAIIAIIFLFGTLVFGAYAVFSPFNAETVDASTPSNQNSDAETTLASNLVATPTPALAVVDAGVTPTDVNQPEALVKDIEPTDSPDSASEEDGAEDAKMAPITATPTPGVFLDADPGTEDVDSDANIDNITIVSTLETLPLPTAVNSEKEAVATVAATATAVPALDDGVKIADGTAVIRTGALNVRTGPGPQFPSTALVYNGEYVILMGRNGDNSWVKVRSLNGIVGWIYAAHIEAGQPLSEIPFIPRAQR